MTIFLHGADTFRSRERLRQLTSAFREKHDPQGYNLTRLDCTAVEPGAVLEAILAAPFLAAKRMVVLGRLFEAGNAELEDMLLERIGKKSPLPAGEGGPARRDVGATEPERSGGMRGAGKGGGEGKQSGIPDDVILVIWTGPPPTARKSAAADKKKPPTLYPRLAKEEHAQEYKPLAGVELARWIANYAKARDGSLAPEALTALVQAAGSDLWQITAILDPAFAYAQGRAVTADDIARFAETPLDENAFHFTGALAGKNTKAALSLLQAQWGLGEAPEKLIGLLAWQWRTLLLARDFLDGQSSPRPPLAGEGQGRGFVPPRSSLGEGGGEGGFASSSGLNPFVAGKALRACRGWSRSALESHYETLLSIDHSLKTGGEDPKLQLERFVCEVTDSQGAAY